MFMLNMKKNLLRNPCRRVHFLAKKSNQQCILYKDIKWLFAKLTNVFMRQNITSSITIAISELVYISHFYIIEKYSPISFYFCAKQI